MVRTTTEESNSFGPSTDAVDEHRWGNAYWKGNRMGDTEINIVSTAEGRGAILADQNGMESSSQAYGSGSHGSVW